jgi:hypothetical protein
MQRFARHLPFALRYDVSWVKKVVFQRSMFAF